MTSTNSKTRHALFAGAPSWGHLRPLVSLASRIIHERPDIIITFTLVGPDYKSRLENEIDRYFSDDEKALKDNIRLLHLGGFSADFFEIFQAYVQGFAKVYPAMYAGEPISCATGKIYQGIARPSVIVLDPFLLELLRTIRNISGESVPIIAWNSAALNGTLRFCGPPSLGGLGNVPLKAEKLAEETGRSVDEILTELYQPNAGKVIELPGMPPMYDYEYNSHHVEAQLKKFQNIVLSATFKSLEECDGIITIGNVSIEPETCAAVRTWFTPRPAYFVGPLMPDEAPVGNQLSNSQEKELAGSSNGAEVKEFLDTILGTHGQYSLLYISFGSNFWPIGEAIWKILEIALEMKIPFILSRNPKKVQIPSHIQEQLQASELALVSAWAPQHLILGHRATGWFLTHCGNNSVTESISHGVPMIAWPLVADQPVNAAFISSTLNVAYELFETRVEQGLKPLRRGIHPKGTLEAIEQEARSVFAKAWGPDGMQKRGNVQVLKGKVTAAWDEDGDARKELRQFLNKYLPVADCSMAV